jgi:hypothetical protein
MAARWTIVDDIPQNDFQRSGGIIAGRLITIREVETGREDEFWLPASQYTAEIVAQEAQARADRLLEISRLGGA